MTVLVTRDKSGDVVNAGDTVTDFRGDDATFIQATRARDGHRTGKVLVTSAAGSFTSANIREVYDTVFDLAVTAG